MILLSVHIYALLAVDMSPKIPMKHIAICGFNMTKQKHLKDMNICCGLVFVVSLLCLLISISETALQPNYIMVLSICTNSNSENLKCFFLRV